MTEREAILMRALVTFGFHDFWAQIGIAALLQAVQEIFKETGPSWSREALRDLMHAYWSLGDE